MSPFHDQLRAFQNNYNTHISFKFLVHEKTVNVQTDFLEVLKYNSGEQYQVKVSLSTSLGNLTKSANALITVCT